MTLKSENGNLKYQIAIPLLIWGVINMIMSIIYFFTSSDLIKGVLTQAFFWGCIDGIIGLVTLIIKKDFDLTKIKKIFLVNVYLDVLYVFIGLFLVILGSSTYLIGNGYGVIIQGLFLFSVDIIHHNHIKKILIEKRSI
jgi:hypothetical protein